MASLLAYEAAVVAIVGVLLAGLFLGRGRGAAVTDLVVQLGQARSGTLRAELARAIGDPALEVGYWLPEAGTFDDAAGGTLSLPDAGLVGRRPWSSGTAVRPRFLSMTRPC